MNDDIRQRMLTYDNDDGSEDLPDEPPVGTRPRVVADHQFNVVQVAIDAVVPRDERHLEESQNQSRKGGRVRVDQLQDVHSTLAAHYQS